jgi:predicted ATPase with chaperone activity
MPLTLNLTEIESQPVMGSGLLASLLAGESFHPAEPRTLEETGLPASMVESLICKYLSLVGTVSGRNISSHLCLPFPVVESVLAGLRTRQLIVHVNAAALGDYNYRLTDQGRERAVTFMEACAYVGPAPVPLNDYIVSVEAQSVRGESPKRGHLEKAFSKICIIPQLFDALGPAINSGAGMFLYGSPGNGKSTIARCITRCFGQHIWLPQTLIDDGQLIKLYDTAYHEAVEKEESSIIKAQDYDRRWIKIKRPTVVVGGELTLDGLEIRHDPRGNVSEAPLQLKSNCGCFLIDDFGRQRIEPKQLLNRWIVPLENRVDYLTLATGKKITVPFEQLIIFSTNLEPADLVDEAFLRRIPYKIKIDDPEEDEFLRLFELNCHSFGCELRKEVVEYILATHFRPYGRAMRRCQPRDLLGLVRNLCSYHDVPLEMRPEYFDHAVRTYFTMVIQRNSH